MRKIGDLNKGTFESHTAYLTSVELFFLGLSGFFVVLKLLPIRISPFVFGILVVAIWYYSMYFLRKKLMHYAISLKMADRFKMLEKGEITQNRSLSVVIFCFAFGLFCFLGVILIGGYYKN